MKPDNPSQNHWYPVASVGKKIPRVKNVVMPRKPIAKNKRIKLTDKELILCPAFSKNSALIVQQTETPNPAISPICELIIFFFEYKDRVSYEYDFHVLLKSKKNFEEQVNMYIFEF